MPYWHQPLIHRPVADKLVGVVALGLWHEQGDPTNTNTLCLATISITNPNCNIPIALTQMSFIRGDDGMVIYEGPFLATIDNQGTKQIVDQLLPHRSSGCQLRYCMPITTGTAPNTVYGFPDPGTVGHWLTPAQAVGQLIRLYTVEIEWWAAAQEAHPPIAFLQQQNVRMVGTSPAHVYMSSNQMVSLKHYKD
jgi:hypothetical protein